MNDLPGTEGYQKYYDFLIDLRDSGVTNMWGAAPYLAEAFGMSNREAGKILIAWIETFNRK